MAAGRYHQKNQACLSDRNANQIARLESDFDELDISNIDRVRVAGCICFASREWSEMNSVSYNAEGSSIVIMDEPTVLLR